MLVASEASGEGAAVVDESSPDAGGGVDASDGVEVEIEVDVAGGGVEVGVLVASSTSVQSVVSVSVATVPAEEVVVASPGKITFHEKWSVTAAGVSDSSLAWNDPQNNCASAPSSTAEFAPVKTAAEPTPASGAPSAFAGLFHPPRQLVG